jgi:beta-aspartyl-peptidase (threonine type)
MSYPLLLVHGGAGNVPASSQEAHRLGCQEAAEKGGAVLADGGTAVEAACTAVEVLEDNPIYNAGLGCALDLEGRVSLDVAVMCGQTLEAAGLAALSPFKNPVRIAQRLLHEKEVLLAGEEASRRAEALGFERLSAHALITEKAMAQWRKVVRDGECANFAGGTVGAVARDAHSFLAAATSTGGTMGKAPGRVGDSPLIGAGTFANEHCAVSATGEGEAFVRSCFAVRIADAIRYGQKPSEALLHVLTRVKDRYHGVGGAIVLTADGDPITNHTTPGMSCGWWSPDGSGSSI